MKAESKENYLTKNQKTVLIVLFILIISIFVFFKNIFFESSFLLKSLGKSSMDPEIAFSNNKPTFLEFYAEWCEVCKKMSHDVSDFKKDFDEDINFVFLNVDNPRWERYIKKYKVNGIPQINLFKSGLELNATFIGLQKEGIIKNALENLLIDDSNFQNQEIINSNFSSVKDNIHKDMSPRDHG